MLRKRFGSIPWPRLNGKPSSHIDPVVVSFASDMIDVSFQKAKYRFQNGGENVLVTKKIENGELFHTR